MFWDIPFLLPSLLFALGAVALTAGLVFAAKASAPSHGKIPLFTQMQSIENRFYDNQKSGRPRNLLYIRISVDHIREYYSVSQADLIDANVTQILLNRFTHPGCSIAKRGNDFVVLCDLAKPTVSGIIDACLSDVQKLMEQAQIPGSPCLHFGCYYLVASSVSFDEALVRVQRANSHAVSMKRTVLEWEYQVDKELMFKKQLINSMETNLEDIHFILEFQPVVDAKTGKVVAGEALTRLFSGSQGVVPPHRFLDSVQSAGVSAQFDYLIFEKCCAWLANHTNLHPDFLFLSCNFSRTTLSEPDFVGRVITVMEKYNIPSSRIAVEILEDSLKNPEDQLQLHQNLQMLRDYGIHISLDDFGVSSTTFSDLQIRPVNMLKIDKSVIANLNTERGRKIFADIMNLARSFHLKVVCEGVETKAQCDAVTAMGCDLIQGFFFYRPLCAEDFENKVCYS